MDKNLIPRSNKVRILVILNKKNRPDYFQNGFESIMNTTIIIYVVRSFSQSLLLVALQPIYQQPGHLLQKG